jgi:hypothetical protein
MFLSNGTYFNTLRFEQAQRKQGLTDLNRQRLTPTRTATQHPDRFAGNKTQLFQAAQSCGTHIGGTRHDALYQRMGAFRQFRQEHDVDLMKFGAEPYQRKCK